MSIIKGKTNIVAGFGGTKRCIGEVYFSQSGLSSDNPGALPGWTGEYYENGKTLFPDLYNFVKAHSELQVTKSQYDNAIATYGECPKYVVDEVEGSLRLPKYANYIKMANSAEGITQSKAGLPEIRSFVNTAAGNPSQFPNLPSYARAIPNTASYSLMTGSTISSVTSLAYVENYASLYDSIYGSSGTVTPAHTTLYPWIVAYTSAVPASTAQAAEFTGALAGKANADLSNCPPNYDYVVDSGVLEDGSWWRRHKSGWLEQGNSSPTGDQGFTLNKTINFPKPFADNTYMLVGPGFYISNAGAQTITRTATGFTTSSAQNLTGCAYWYACGQGAED